MNLFELDFDIKYETVPSDGNVYVKKTDEIGKPILYFYSGEQLNVVVFFNLQREFVELPHQRDLCECGLPAKIVPNYFYCGFDPSCFQYYSALYCGRCNKHFENPKDKLPEIFSRGKIV